MPGVNLNLPIPSLSDTQTQVVTKTAQALTAIGNDLASKVTTAEIDFNSAVPFNGFQLQNVGSILFADSLASSTPGTILYSGGEWFLVDSTGPVKITNNGLINLSVLGAIGGDYTTVNALLSYDSANTRYRFFGSGGTTLVDLDARSYAANNTGTGKVILSADASLTSTLNLAIKSLPASLIAPIAYDATTGTVVDGSTITAAQTYTGTVTCTNNVTFNGLVKHPAYTTEIPLFVGEETQTNAQTGAGGLTGIVSTNQTTWSSSPFGICGLRTNDIVQSITIRINKISTDPATITVKKRAAGGSTTTVATTGGSSSTTGNQDITATITTPTAIATRERWWVELGFKQATVSAATVSWTQ